MTKSFRFCSFSGNRKGFRLKKYRKADDSRSFDPRSKNREGNNEKPVLFQLGSTSKVSDARLKADPEIIDSRCTSLSLSSFQAINSRTGQKRNLAYHSIEI